MNLYLFISLSNVRSFLHWESLYEQVGKLYQYETAVHWYNCIYTGIVALYY